MKALSLWQPWASLWLTDRKLHETRHWATRYRGPLLVHAAKRMVSNIDEQLLEVVADEFGGHWSMDLPRGAIIGRLELIDIVPTESLPKTHSVLDDYVCGDFSPGRFAWKRGAFEVFKQPIPYRGMQTIFEVPAEVLLPGAVLPVEPPKPKQGALQL
jgi:hypothetical protein